MTPQTLEREKQGKGPNVIFLFPEILRPQKLNHAHLFELLSASCHGQIFTMSSQPHKGMRIAGFRLRSAGMRRSSILNWISRLHVQMVLPVWYSIRGTPVDAIVTYDPYASGIPAVILKWVLRAKLIVQVMGDYHRLDPNDELLGEYGSLRKTGGVLKKALMNAAFRISMSAADAIKVLNKDQEQYVREKWPSKSVYRFADFAATQYFGSLATIQGDYLLAVGHPFHRKGIDVLVQAFAKIADDYPSMRLRIIGYAPEAELESYRALAGHHPRIEFIKAGWIEDVAELMRGCYGFVHAARSEAMGRVLLEAMACRKPIVTTRTNGALDYVVDGATAILCKIDDIDDLASAMRRLLGDPELARRMGQAGFDHLHKESSEERFAERFISMLEEVIRGSTRP
jgi:glycosyltransferase involved in cell wall biosynthesis